MNAHPSQPRIIKPTHEVHMCRCKCAQHNPAGPDTPKHTDSVRDCEIGSLLSCVERLLYARSRSRACGTSRPGPSAPWLRRRWQAAARLSSGRSPLCPLLSAKLTRARCRAQRLLRGVPPACSCTLLSAGRPIKELRKQSAILNTVSGVLQLMRAVMTQDGRRQRHRGGCGGGGSSACRLGSRPAVAGRGCGGRQGGDEAR